MNYPKPATSEERAALDNAMRSLRAEWGFAASFTIANLLERWTKLVNDVESGYSLSLPDYTNDLALRDALCEIVKCVPERLSRELSHFLEPWDERFQFATKIIDIPLLPVDGSAGPWWWRIPKQPHGELLENLLSEGII